MGVMLLVFTPLPYVDVTSSWSFRSRWHRALVGAAGMMTEVFMAALATFLRARCGPTVDVGTDLSAWACFPLSTCSERVRLDDFPSLPSLVQHFQGQFESLYGHGVFDECAECRHRRRKQCAGGCAAQVYRAQ